MTYDHLRIIADRYPRVIHAMQWTASLSETEAAACIRDYKAGELYSGEAVNHYGGTHAVMDRATSSWVRAIIADLRREETRRLVLAYEMEQAVNQALATRYGKSVRGVDPE